MNDLRKIGLLGASGRMGRTIAELVGTTYSKQATMAESVDMQRGCMEDFAGVDAIIDFSLPAGTASLLDWMESREGPLPAVVCGTTGLDDSLLERLRRLGQRTRVIQANNFSPGIAALTSILHFAAPVLRKLGYAAKMTDIHHMHKKDAPSGTAITLARAMDPEHPESTEISSVREGEVIGAHDVVFEGSSDRITIGHEALNRDLFARGAIEAALWLCGLEENTGIFTMNEYFERRYLS